MTSTKTGIFDATLQKSEQWLDEIERELGTDNPQQAYHALRATLQTVRDQLPDEEAVDLAAQLPTIIRGVYYEGWRPSETPRKQRNAEGFLDAVRDRYDAQPPANLEEIVRAALKVMVNHVSLGETMQVFTDMPKELRGLWPTGQ